ncbi:hypothetical protein [Ruminococcus sp.]
MLCSKSDGSASDLGRNGKNGIADLVHLTNFSCGDSSACKT